MKNIYKCIVTKNEKRYYKSVKGKWKRISNKMGEKVEKNKRTYRVNDDINIQHLPDVLLENIARKSGEHKGPLGASSRYLNRVTQPLLNEDRKKEIEKNIKTEEDYIVSMQRDIEEANRAIDEGQGGSGWLVQQMDAFEGIENSQQTITELREELKNVEANIEQDKQRLR